MAVYLNDDLEDLQDDRFDSDGFGVSGSRDGHPSSPNKHKNDTSAVEYRNGKDMQGIPWERLKYSRDQYRKMRLKHYKNYENLARSHQGFDMECKQVETNDKFYDFCFNTRLVKPTIVHFQLRNLVWATSKHDVYMAQNNSVMHWSSLLQRGTEVLHVAGQVVPKQKTHGARTLSRVQISTMALKDNLMVAGGFRGELIFKYVDKPGVAFCTNAADNKNSVTNAVDVYESPSGATRVTAANNDCTVKFLDAERCSLLSRFTFPWSVNNTSVSPDGKLLAVLGDSSDCVITDAQSGDSDSQRAPGLLVLIGLAPRRARPGDGEPGQDVPAVGHAQPVGAVRGAGREDRRGPGPPVLVGRAVPGGGGGGGLRPRVRRAGRLRRRAGDRAVRGDRGRGVQPGRGRAVRRGRGPGLRQPARVRPAGPARLPGLVPVTEWNSHVGRASSRCLDVCIVLHMASGGFCLYAEWYK
ncbi:uncharacterized protein [Aegilops tauschii subsp. strangulata]|nr:uncharacterized protein LOC109773616 isoform X3 [Aegilops tauschii subsp. strangulata]